MKKTKKEGFFKENYSKSWQFIKESKNFIYAIIAIFFGFALISFFFQVPDYLAREIMKTLEEIVNRTEGLSQFELIKFIFFNNLQSSFLGLILGVFLGIFPLIFAAFNGYVLGFVADMAVDVGGISVLWRLLPHGIFELPAVFISLGLGFRFGVFILKNPGLKSIKEYSYEVIRVFICVVIPLLILAAIIEGSLISLFE